MLPTEPSHRLCVLSLSQSHHARKFAQPRSSIETKAVTRTLCLLVLSLLRNQDTQRKITQPRSSTKTEQLASPNALSSMFSLIRFHVTMKKIAQPLSTIETKHTAFRTLVACHPGARDSSDKSALDIAVARVNTEVADYLREALPEGHRERHRCKRRRGFERAGRWMRLTRAGGFLQDLVSLISGSARVHVRTILRGPVCVFPYSRPVHPCWVRFALCSDDWERSCVGIFVVWIVTMYLRLLQGQLPRITHAVWIVGRYMHIERE